MDKKNTKKIALAILVCLIIIAIPLTVMLVANNMTSSQNSPDNNPPIENVEDNIVVYVSIDAYSLFGETGVKYIDDVKKRMGEALFNALNEGNILPKFELTLPKGATAMYATKQALTSNSIGIAEARGYVSSIAGLGEKMAGDMSGWVYTYNGERIMAGANNVRLKSGDSIEWHYIVGDKTPMGDAS